MNRHERRKQAAMAEAYGVGKAGNHNGSKHGFHKGSFGKAPAEKKGYKPLSKTAMKQIKKAQKAGKK